MTFSHIYTVIGFFCTLLILEIRFLLLLRSVGLDHKLCKCIGTNDITGTYRRLRNASQPAGFRWVASLALQRRNPPTNESGPFSLFCSASVLSPNFLITAARCFKAYRHDGFLVDKLEDDYYNDATFALAGTHDFTRGSLIEPSIQRILPYNVFIHPQYDYKLTLWNSTRLPQSDLALIKLTDPFELGNNIFPSCLFEFDREEFKNASLIAAGFGSRNSPSSYYYQLRKTTELKQLSSCTSRNITYNVSSTLCAGDENSSFYFDSGDLGGPIHYESEGRLFLVGVLNGADGEAVRPSALSYSTLVKPFMEWIDGNIQHNRCITKEFGPLRTYSLIAIISATCFFIILYSTYLVKAKNRLEKEAKESKVNPV